MKRIFSGPVLYLMLAFSALTCSMINYDAARAANLTPQPVVAPAEKGMATLHQSHRATDIIGSNVYDENGERIGTVSDLLVSPNEKILYAIISRGGFLGIGERLVSVPYAQLVISGDRILLGESRDSLEQRPFFHYLK